MGLNINCKKIDNFCICHHPKVKDLKFLWFKFRPQCKLVPPFVFHTDTNGNVYYDNKCKYQEKYPKPNLIKEMF